MAQKKHSRRRGSKSKRGGSSYSSASSYGEYVNGGDNAQFSRVFSTSGPYANIQGNVSIGAQGQNANQPSVPNAQNLSLIQKAGRRSRSRRGGLWGSVINQAIVPFSILGMQQTYRRKKYGGKKHTRGRRHR